MVGRQNFSSPTIDVIGNRALPSSFQGVALHSEEFNNLSFDAGSFDRVSPRTEQGLKKFRSEYGATRSRLIAPASPASTINRSKA